MSARTPSLLFLVCVLAAGSPLARAQGGPPFRTDDPETPGNKHWEINFGFIGDRNPAAGAYQVPDFDINYGLGDRIQLKYEIPIAIEEIRLCPQALAGPARGARCSEAWAKACWASSGASTSTIRAIPL